NLAQCGIDVVCYNFMPVLDWTRTQLAHRLPDGAWALRFDQDAFAAFDLCILQRDGAEAEYTAEEIERARGYHAGLDEAGREELVRTLIAGL
ncbi:mannonate dehydratase, partial [Streptomyces sp. CHB9.2]|nr:mannonate dehydratase [Streptomyces sp. CHB9.2]